MTMRVHLISIEIVLLLRENMHHFIVQHTIILLPVCSRSGGELKIEFYIFDFEPTLVKFIAWMCDQFY